MEQKVKSARARTSQRRRDRKVKENARDLTTEDHTRGETAFLRTCARARVFQRTHETAVPEWKSRVSVLLFLYDRHRLRSEKVEPVDVEDVQHEAAAQPRVVSRRSDPVGER